MLMRSQPALRLDRPVPPGTWSRPVPLPVDVVRTAEETVFTIDLPGIDPGAIDLEITPDLLTVRAERRPSQIGAGDRLCVSERRLGIFTRRLALAEPVDVERASASYDAGVLTIRVPAAHRPHRRRIMVTTTPADVTTASRGAARADGAA